MLIYLERYVDNTFQAVIASFLSLSDSSPAVRETRDLEEAEHYFKDKGTFLVGKFWFLIDILYLLTLRILLWEPGGL